MLVKTDKGYDTRPYLGEGGNSWVNCSQISDTTQYAFINTTELEKKDLVIKDQYLLQCQKLICKAI
jgi:hypothetical protein